MPEVTSHAPGAFCWFELNTSNRAAAKEFYGSLFDWQFDDMQAAPEMGYTMIMHKGLEVGALCDLQPEQKANGVPPHWMSYVSVENADASVKKAAELGATIIVDAMDVMDVGRMAVLQEPQGAMFCVWQAKAHIGVRLVGEINTFVWDELWSNDTAKSEQFYTALFGWGAKFNADAGPGGYTEWQIAGQSIGGMMTISPEMGPIPPNWLPYLMVTDCDVIADKAQKAGGQLCMPPMDIPEVGRFAVIQDPQGAMFAIIKLASTT